MFWIAECLVWKDDACSPAFSLLLLMSKVFCYAQQCCLAQFLFRLAKRALKKHSHTVVLLITADDCRPASLTQLALSFCDSKSSLSPSLSLRTEKCDCSRRIHWHKGILRSDHSSHAPQREWEEERERVELHPCGLVSFPRESVWQLSNMVPLLQSCPPVYWSLLLGAAS